MPIGFGRRRAETNDIIQHTLQRPEYVLILALSLMWQTQITPDTVILHRYAELHEDTGEPRHASTPLLARVARSHPGAEGFSGFGGLCYQTGFTGSSAPMDSAHKMKKKLDHQMESPKEEFCFPENFTSNQKSSFLQYVPWLILFLWNIV